MSVTPSPIGGFAAQFFDNNGVILSGGKIYTYAAGTTTPQASYTSALGITPHSNPIVLDSAGRVPGGEIWLTDGLVYKFVIETATAVLIGTYDNITGVNSNFVNYTVQEEVITATAGQTVFNLSTINYTPGTNSLSVYIDGVNQYVGDSYLETDSDTVTFTAGVHVGGEVKFTTAVQTNTGAIDANSVGYMAPFAGAAGQSVQTKLQNQPLYLEDFGGGGGATGVQNATALRAALAAVSTSGGGVILLRGSVNYNVDSATWGPLGPGVIPANTTIATTGGKATITFTGATFIFGLRATSVSNVLVKDIVIVGNGSAASLLEFHLAVGAVAPMINVYAENIRLENCAAETGFFTIINYNTTYAMDKVGAVDGAEFIPAPNAVPVPDRANIAKSYAAIYINATAGGAIRNLRLERPIGGLNDYKMGIFGSGNIDTVSVVEPIFTGVGQSYFAPANEGRGYRGIAFYRDSGLLSSPPRNIVIDNPTITSPIDNGIYLQSCSGVVINSPKISGQNGDFDNNLAEAGIYSNGSTKVVINDANFQNNYRDIVVGGSDTTDDLDFQINGGFLRGAAAGSIMLNPALSPITVWNNLKINNVVIRDALYGVFINFNTTSAGEDIIFSNCDIEASGASSYGITSNGLNASGDIKFVGCRIKGGACQVNMISTIGSLEFDGSTIETGSTIADFVFNVAGQKLRLFNTHFAATSTSNPFTGNAQILTGVVGAGSIARNCTFSNTSNPVTGSNIMAALPTWSGASGDFVQSGNSAEQGSTPNKYVRSGWICSGGTTWLEQRQLTGN
jgi:hypothetical protein